MTTYKAEAILKFPVRFEFDMDEDSEEYYDSEEYAYDYLYDCWYNMLDDTPHMNIINLEKIV